MIAYNRDWLDALRVKDQAEQWRDENLLDETQWQNIQAAYPSPFYSPNIFVRIGLAAFCGLMLLAAVGLLGVLAGINDESVISFYCLLWSIVCFAILEYWLIPVAKHYRSGMDDMLVYVGSGLAVIAVYIALPDTLQEVKVAYLLTAVAFTGATIRYGDRLTALAAFGYGYLALVLFAIDIMHTSVAAMLYAAITYFGALHYRKQYACRFWDDALAVVELAALAAFYFSGNYWVMEEKTKIGIQEATVPGAWFFWTFTFIVPVVYLYFGWRRKDRMLLDLGIGTVAAAIFTYRYFYSVLPLEWAATIGGAILFIVAWWAIRKLRDNKIPGYAYAENGRKNLLQEAEEQLIEQTLGSQGPPTTRNDGMGGGQFGGGGGGGEF